MNLIKIKKNSICAIAVFISAVLFLPLAAGARTQNCNTSEFFRKGTSMSLFFPAGGGYNNDAKVSLPMKARISAATVDFVPQNITGTPYIWIPNSGSGTVAQLRTKNGTLVKLYQNNVGGFPGDAFSLSNSGISRVTVIPGGDVYIANRGNQYITRLKPKAAPSEEYEYGGRLDMGAPWTRAVTFDKKGNVWGATCGNGGNDRIKVFCGSGAGCGAFNTELASLTNGKCHYGAIADKYGFTWTVGSAEIRSYSYNSGTITEKSTGSVSGSYGIGIDNNQDLWVGKRGPSAGVHKVSRNTSGGITGISTFSSLIADNTGVAVDGIGNVWVDGWGTNKVSRFNISGTLIANYDAGGNPHGAAIDFNNNVWLVNYGGGAPPSKTVLNPSGCAAGSGSVTVYKSDGTYVATYTTCGNTPYNYSDMTGFRSIPNALTVSDTEYLPVGNTYSGFGDKLDVILQKPTCTCVVNGIEQCAPDPGDATRCVIPLSLFSVTGGEYMARNLFITCSETLPDIIEGLVSCGRLNDNVLTPEIDESKPCDLCSMLYMLKKVLNYMVEVALVIALLMIIIAGLLYAFSAGDTHMSGKAKDIIYYTLLGLAIMIVAWVIIAAILNGMGYANISKWDQIDCVLQK